MADDKNRWIIIYPAYINVKKTQAEGRKIPKAKAVDLPQVNEIKDVLTSKGFKTEIEAKHYPREQARDHIHSGRIRVQLFDEGKPVNPEFHTRRDIMLLACDLIPKLKTRQSRGAESAELGQGSRKKKGKRK